MLIGGPRSQQENLQQDQDGNFYDALTASFAPNAYHQGQAASFPCEQLNNNSTAWVSGSALPEDDDPLLQRRLQQLVEQHRPSASRNVLRELADVAEQQSGPKRRAQEVDSSEDEEEEVRKHGKKQRKLLPSSISSRAQKQMQETIAKRNDLRDSITNIKVQLNTLQEKYEASKSQLPDIERLVEDTSQELADELLQDNTTWNQMYCHLLDFHRRNGHLRIPWKKEEKEKDPIIGKLGPWLVQQRKDYRKDPANPERLEPYKIVALERLNIEWEPNKVHWLNRYEDLKRFKGKNGHCRVPYHSACNHKKAKNYEIAEDEERGEHDQGSKIKYDSLGVWVKRQRNQYKNFKCGNENKAGEMTEERIKLLEDIGFEWSLRSASGHPTWLQFFEEIKQFKETHGHSRVDEKQTKALSEWVKNMRFQVRKYKEGSEDNILSKEQFDMLKQLDLDSTLRESKFEARFGELKEFQEAHGHCVVPTIYAANQKLSNWVQTQKRQYKLLKEGKKSQMSEEKCKLLKDAGFEFEVSKERKSEITKQMNKSWNEFFAELEQYKERYGQISAIKQRKKKSLREWCDEQRVQQAKKKWGKESGLTDERILKLTKLGFDWQETDVPSKGWDDYFCDWLSCFIKHSSYDNNHDLKQWVDTQQNEFNKFTKGIPSLLNSSQIRKLKDGNFPLRISQGIEETKESWEEMFAQLLLFKIRYKSFDVPDSSPFKQLHLWISKQRLKKLDIQRRKIQTRSVICEDRVRRLTDVGFDWQERKGKLKESHGVEEKKSNVSPIESSVLTVLPLNTPTISRTADALGEWSGNLKLMLPYTTAQNTFHSIANPTAGKELAAQAASIVADISSRNGEDERERAITDAVI